MIQFFDVTKIYPNNTAALRGLSFHVGNGDFVFLTGPSGSGKSTIIKIILCLEPTTEGQVLIGGRNVNVVNKRSIPYLRRNIGVVWQDFKLLESRSVFDNVAIALEILGAPRREIRRDVDQMLERLGLSAYRNQRPSSLSGGEQQRVAIARALVNKPTLLLADEPTGNLDPALTIEIVALLEEANRAGTTILLATHNPLLLERFSYPIIALNKGVLGYSPRPVPAPAEAPR